MKRTLLVIATVLVVGLSTPAADPKTNDLPSPEEVALCTTLGKLHVQRCAQATFLALPDFDPKDKSPNTQYLIGSCVEGGIAAKEWCLGDKMEAYAKKYNGDDCAAGKAWNKEVLAEGRKRFEAHTGNKSGREDSAVVEKYYTYSWDRFCAKLKADEARSNKDKVTPNPFEKPGVIDL